MVRPEAEEAPGEEEGEPEKEAWGVGGERGERGGRGGAEVVDERGGGGSCGVEQEERRVCGGGCGYQYL